MPQDRTPFVCFLTDSETNNSLCLRYWSIDDSGKWAEPYTALQCDAGLSRVEMIRMLKSACRAYLPHLRCNACGTAIEVGARRDYSPATGSLLGWEAKWTPPQCASCDAAALAAKQKASLCAERQRHDRMTYGSKGMRDQSEPIDFAHLSYMQSCFLYAILVAADVGRTNQAIPSLEYLTFALAATHELAEKIYTQLYANKILVPAPATIANHTRLDEATGAGTINLRTSRWVLAPDIAGRSLDDIFAVLSDRMDHPEPQAVKELWYLVAESECQKYFIHQCMGYRFCQPGLYSSKVAASIRHCLDRLSIGQVCNIIHYTLKDLAALSQRRGYTRQEIYSMVPGSLRRAADYRLPNGKPIHPWRRPSPATEPWLTTVLLDDVLKDGDISFETLKGKEVAAHVQRQLGVKDETEPAAMRN